MKYRSKIFRYLLVISMLLATSVQACGPGKGKGVRKPNLPVIPETGELQVAGIQGVNPALALLTQLGVELEESLPGHGFEIVSEFENQTISYCITFHDLSTSQVIPAQLSIANSPTSPVCNMELFIPNAKTDF